ncbi:MAG: hypothetical protein KGJ07_10490, partial [Patescibacteria group bacterium]|nr:hypothetical protein [Patescibacteria group bacterium]
MGLISFFNGSALEDPFYKRIWYEYKMLNAVYKFFIYMAGFFLIAIPIFGLVTSYFQTLAMKRQDLRVEAESARIINPAILFSDPTASGTKTVVFTATDAIGVYAKPLIVNSPPGKNENNSNNAPKGIIVSILSIFTKFNSPSNNSSNTTSGGSTTGNTTTSGGSTNTGTNNTSGTTNAGSTGGSSGGSSGGNANTPTPTGISGGGSSITNTPTPTGSGGSSPTGTPTPTLQPGQPTPTLTLTPTRTSGPTYTPTPTPIGGSTNPTPTPIP